MSEPETFDDLIDEIKKQHEQIEKLLKERKQLDEEFKEEFFGK